MFKFKIAPSMWREIERNVILKRNKDFV